MPYIEGYTEGETVQRDQQVELTCRSRGGNPPAQIVWFRNDKQVTTEYRSEGSLSESILTFKAMAQDDKARYRCEVSNIMSVEPMKVHVDLTVLCKYQLYPKMSCVIVNLTLKNNNKYKYESIIKY